jgi:hypothetical protein
MVDAERKLVLTTCSGSVTDEDLLQARRDVLANPHFDPSFDRLWDFSEVTQQQVSDATMGHLVKTSPSVGNISRAVVVSKAKEPLERVLAFIARSRQLNRRVAVFPNRGQRSAVGCPAFAEASAWQAEVSRDPTQLAGSTPELLSWLYAKVLAHLGSSDSKWRAE